MKLTALPTLIVVMALGFAPTAAPAATVHTTDFIADGSRTNFAGFEPLPDTSTGGPSYVEDGIKVDQIGGDGLDIWTTCDVCFGGTLDGLRAWYPDGGDFGHTRIMRVGDIDFDDVGFRTGSGWISLPTTLHWELWNDGSLLDSGDIPRPGGAAGYLGFSGGGFDEIRLSDTSSGTLNAFAVDSIELANGGGTPPSVPGPASLALLGLGLLGLAATRRR